MDLYRSIGDVLGFEPAEVNTYSPLTLAFIGDGIYEIVIRSLVAGHGNTSPNKLNKESSSLVRAQGQCGMLEAIRPLLTEEEADYFRRGRNAKSGSIAKNATMWEYRRATGFETLMGYLYVTGQMDRLLCLVKAGLDGMAASKDGPVKSGTAKEETAADRLAKSETEQNERE